jgi:putative zinc finger/helix-turn-helix YgiT family protein
MKSPVTGKAMTHQIEKRTMHFRKEAFEVLYHFYLCADSGEQFTTTEMDEINLSQLYHQYRAKFHLPFPEEIAAIRDKYALPANKMAEILGFGVNVYRNYEHGEIPSQSNARLIQLIKDPQEFLKLLKISNVYVGDELLKKTKVVEALIEKEHPFVNFDFEEYLLGEKLADQYTGFRIPNLEKFIEMVVFFAQRIQPYKTKMNKLLFYADFLHFKRTCYSISGSRYIAIQKGPVPKNFGSLFEYAVNHKDIHIAYVGFEEGMGERFFPEENRQFNAGIFTPEELKVLELVAVTFEDTQTNEIVRMAHEEKAWIDNFEGHRPIDYKYGFELQVVGT